MSSSPRTVSFSYPDNQGTDSSTLSRIEATPGFADLAAAAQERIRQDFGHVLGADAVEVSCVIQSIGSCDQ